MYTRLNHKQIADLHASLSKDRLFQNLYPAISAVANKIHDISPEEIWCIAEQLVRQMAIAENDVFEIDSFPHQLFSLLSEYKDETNRVFARQDEHIEQTVFLVELVILYQLVRYQRDIETSPYRKYCEAILGQIQEHPLFEKILPMIRESNDRYEEHYGGAEVEPHDYMPYVIKEDSILRDAMTCSAACSQYLAHGYDVKWLTTFWQSMAQDPKCGKSLLEDLQSKKKHTTIFHIIGVLLQQEVFNGSQIQLSETYTFNSPSIDSIRRYISTGYQDSTSNYAKFVIGYISTYKAQKK